jgi:hypothetical protein
VYNLLIGCKSVASLSATRKKYEDKMFPTDRHYLFNIAEEMQFPAARCAQGNLVCMYGKTASSGVEAMKWQMKTFITGQLWTFSTPR